MYGWRGRIGLLVPSGNNTNEPDFFRMAPSGVAVHASRVYWGEKLESSVEVLHEALKHLEAAVVPLAHARVGVMVYGCTSGSFVEGVGHDVEIIRRIEKLAGVPALTTTTACLEAMQVLGFERMAVATPYPDVVNERLRAFFEGNGIEVVSLETFDQPSVWAHADNSPESIYRLARKAYTGKANGLFISCTQMRAIDVAGQLERDLGVPVVTANQASFWAALRRIGLRDRVQGFGRLFEVEELPDGSAARWRKNAKAPAGA
ncbi:MAG: maleate cis-trans isomerase [Candidatus Tectomicrobia bacterium]|uniref:Maleate cis-trans isomerase n=1 Tax=Tectimicrobiota bacterium TaxID=2528274 RepID=A0A932HZZ9_UNCTE|nr:maleate cis-trans isomerase [Candidatus Tectomicrobia bacterium]